MSAPVKERPRVQADATGRRGGTGTLDAPAIPRQRGTAAVTATAAGRAAADRAYERREQRLRRLTGRSSGEASRQAGSGRTQFVLLVMVLLGAGLIATLWLSTAAAADSYRLQNARDAAKALAEQSEQLHRDVSAMESAPALAQRATALGMVPVTDAARLVVGPDGAVTVVGTPKAAVAPAPLTPPPAPAAPTAVTTADGQVASDATDPAPPAGQNGATPPATGTNTAATNGAGTNGAGTNGAGTNGAGTNGAGSRAATSQAPTGQGGTGGAAGGTGTR